MVLCEIFLNNTQRRAFLPRGPAMLLVIARCGKNRSISVDRPISSAAIMSYDMIADCGPRRKHIEAGCRAT